MGHHIPPVLTVSHKIIALVTEDHLVRAYILLGSLVKFPVDTIFVVVIVYLPAFFYGGTDQLDVQKQSLIIGFTPFVDRIYMFDAGLEILIRHTAKPVYQILGILGSYIPAAQYAVDQHMEFRIFKFPAFQIRTVTA